MFELNWKTNLFWLIKLATDFFWQPSYLAPLHGIDKHVHI